MESDAYRPRCSAGGAVCVWGGGGDRCGASLGIVALLWREGGRGNGTVSWMMMWCIIHYHKQISDSNVEIITSGCLALPMEALCRV